ncbi:DUF397 domain-containing protein [Actinoplanes couchii]|uniref:DUF397 domain-containing protein n=1 Tax=Actinoplanes couchii TaxID=403638 RepID=A0ABQ3XN53_9ACTN|nr:DUF397 domain-containing protein [Actinoplanes couchii]MDR6317911.1 hypothetical protein [Actinoplanes couchii]GID59898.1 hypothetical protein Aco03nite_083020 [Actinoplanes couchii]
MTRGKFTTWFKSSKSDGASNCVEASFADDGTVGVRDSKNPVGPVLAFTPGEWSAFVAGVRAGEFAPTSTGDE